MYIAKCFMIQSISRVGEGQERIQYLCPQVMLGVKVALQGTAFICSSFEGQH
jgi:hypothetical protein